MGAKVLKIEKFLYLCRKIKHQNKMKKILTCLLATFGLTSACGQQNYENTDVQEFSELITNPKVVLLDVRTAEEYAD